MGSQPDALDVNMEEFSSSIEAANKKLNVLIEEYKQALNQKKEAKDDDTKKQINDNISKIVTEKTKVRNYLIQKLEKEIKKDVANADEGRQVMNVLSKLITLSKRNKNMEEAKKYAEDKKTLNEAWLKKVPGWEPKATKPKAKNANDKANDEKKPKQARKPQKKRSQQGMIQSSYARVYQVEHEVSLLKQKHNTLKQRLDKLQRQVPQHIPPARPAGAPAGPVDDDTKPDYIPIKIEDPPKMEDSRPYLNAFY